MIIFESLPGFFVTPNLYRPNQPGRYPAVLFQSGHTQEGKPEPQRAAANLALKGFVVLCFDPMGQGEREQTYDPNSRRLRPVGQSTSIYTREPRASSLARAWPATSFGTRNELSTTCLAGLKWMLHAWELWVARAAEH